MTKEKYDQNEHEAGKPAIMELEARYLKGSAPAQHSTKFQAAEAVYTGAPAHYKVVHETAIGEDITPHHLQEEHEEMAHEKPDVEDHLAEHHTTHHEPQHKAHQGMKHPHHHGKPHHKAHHGK